MTFNCIECIYRSKTTSNPNQKVFCSLLKIKVYEGTGRVDLTKYCSCPNNCPLKIEFEHQW